MHRLNELMSKLTPLQVKEVEDFAEFLVVRGVRDGSGPGDATPKYVDVDGLLGLCKGMGGDRSDKELIREAWDAVVDKHSE